MRQRLVFLSDPISFLLWRNVTICDAKCDVCAFSPLHRGNYERFGSPDGFLSNTFNYIHQCGEIHRTSNCFMLADVVRQKTICR